MLIFWKYKKTNIIYSITLFKKKTLRRKRKLCLSARLSLTVSFTLLVMSRGNNVRLCCERPYFSRIITQIMCLCVRALSLYTYIEARHTRIYNNNDCAGVCERSRHDHVLSVPQLKVTSHPSTLRTPCCQYTHTHSFVQKKNILYKRVRARGVPTVAHTMNSQQSMQMIHASRQSARTKYLPFLGLWAPKSVKPHCEKSNKLKKCV